MRVFRAFLFRNALRPGLLALLLACAGCRTSTKSLFEVSGPGWRVQQGQALWRPRRGFPELGGDLVVARHEDGRCFIQFAKTPMTLACAQTTPTRWLIQFPAGNMSFTGHEPPPTRFGWLHLGAALEGKPLPKRLQFESKPEGAWRLENTRSGETMEGFLTP